MNSSPQCARCKLKRCQAGKDYFEYEQKARVFYEDTELIKLHRAATAVEGRYYCKENRLKEVILFSKEMGYSRLGLAFCVGLSNEARVIEEILSKYFEVTSVCCKVCGIDKKDYDLEQIDASRKEYMCNPAAQAGLMNKANTEFNIICGLCVGHDAIFTKCSEAPVSTLIAKDRTLAHNPAGAIYCQYVTRQLEN
jgi:uncharacterized metal-binding protein